MRRVSVLIFAMLTVIILIFAGCSKDAFDPKEFTDGELNVTPNPNMFVRGLAEEGNVIFRPSGNGYRYGPTIFVNADNSIDAWYAAPGGVGQWDWIYYRSSTDGGLTWSEEHVAIQGSTDSMDHYSTCDPGVVKIGDYYYLGYTSTIDLGGIANNAFVARSKKPEGPYEKWNGSGWGGDPWPIIYFDEDPTAWGCGELSFVVMGDKLHIYYTWTTKTVEGRTDMTTRVAIADATDPNWPKTIEYVGIALDRNKYVADSIDVKYIEDFGKFVAVGTRDRFTDKGHVVVFESNDGVTFTETGTMKTNIAQYCHNAGISSRPNGHIRLSDPTYISYGFGDKVPVWATMFQPVEWYLDDNPEDPERKKRTEFVPFELTVLDEFVGTALVVAPPIIRVNENEIKAHIPLHWYDGWFRGEPLDPNIKGVKYYGYDKKVIKIKDGYIYPISPGVTKAYVELNGYRFDFKVHVFPAREELSREKVVSVNPVHQEYKVSLNSNIPKNIRVLVKFEDYTWTESELNKNVKDGSNKDGVDLIDVMSFSGFDENIISVSLNGFITPKAKGSTTVTVSYGGKSTEVKVVVED